MVGLCLRVVTVAAFYGGRTRPLLGLILVGAMLTLGCVVRRNLPIAR